MIVLLIVLPLAGLLGGVLLGSSLAKDPDGLEALARRIDVVRQSTMVLGRVMEEGGIQFNRDYDGNITGLVIDVQAQITAIGGVNNG